MPGDLFYPTAVDTTIMIAQAHRPQMKSDKIFMAKIWNDGYKKLKGKRVEVEGSQLPEVLDLFKKFMKNKKVKSELVTIVSASQIMEVGAEFSPEQYLPQPELSEEEQNIFVENITKSILTASVCIEDIADEVLTNFPLSDDKLPELPYGKSDNIEKFLLFQVENQVVKVITWRAHVRMYHQETHKIVLLD